MTPSAASELMNGVLACGHPGLAPDQIQHAQWSPQLRNALPGLLNALNQLIGRHILSRQAPQHPDGVQGLLQILDVADVDRPALSQCLDILAAVLLLLGDDQIRRDAHILKDIPIIIVQGRYDAICPPKSAYDLAKAMPWASLKIVPVAGHSAFEPAIQHELICATDAI